MKKTLTLLLCLAVIQLFAGTNFNKESNHLLRTNLVSKTNIREVIGESAYSFDQTGFLKSSPTTNVLQDKVVQPANQSVANIPCDCNTDMYVIANPGVRKIRSNETNLYYSLGTTITLTPQNICNPASCLTEWTMKVFDAQTGSPVTNGANFGNNSSMSISLSSLAGYKVEFTGSCRGRKCTFTFWIRPKPGSGVTCDCNTDMYVIANPGGFKVRCNEKKYFNYGTTITLIPQNICNPAECLTEWTIRVFDSQTGAPITNGHESGSNTTFPFTLNSVAGYRVEFTGTCNGKSCKCQFWIQTKVQSTANKRVIVNKKLAIV